MAGYGVERLIGRGGMGVVYEATQLSLERRLALKILHPELSDDPAFLDRFRREGRLQATLDHPNVVTVHEAGESEHGLFLAMQLVEGPSLAELLRSGSWTRPPHSGSCAKSPMLSTPRTRPVLCIGT